MPPIKSAELFLLIIVDQDMKVFNLVGPMSDDTDWNHLVSEARRKGRDIRIEKWADSTSTRDEIIAEIRKRLNYDDAEISLL